MRPPILLAVALMFVLAATSCLNDIANPNLPGPPPPNPTCKANKDCSSGICIDQSYYIGIDEPNTCIPPERLVFVNNQSAELNINKQIGSRENPYPDIRPAINSISPDNMFHKYIIVAASTLAYNRFDIDMREGASVVLLGAWADPATAGVKWNPSTVLGLAMVKNTEASTGKIQDSALKLKGGSAIADGLLFLSAEMMQGGYNHSLISCDKGRNLTVRRSVVNGSPSSVGIDYQRSSQGNRIIIDRSIIRSNYTGIKIDTGWDGLADITISNSLLIDNISAAVRIYHLRQGSTVSVVGSTLLWNGHFSGDEHYGGLECVYGLAPDTTVRAYMSLFFGNSGTYKVQQNCVKTIPVYEPQFTKQGNYAERFQLWQEKTNDSLFDQGDFSDQNGWKDAPRVDFFGTLRPQRYRGVDKYYDVGFYEVPDPMPGVAKVGQP